MGSSQQTFSVDPGVTKLKIPAAAGTIQVTMTRNGQVIASAAPTDFTYTNNPVRYNYNAYVGAAIGGSSTPTQPDPTPTGLSIPTSTSVSGSTWTFQGCYQDSVNNRVFPGGLAYSNANANAVGSCLAACAAGGFQYGAPEYGQECWCGNSLPSNVVLKPNSDCNMACPSLG